APPPSSSFPYTTLFRSLIFGHYGDKIGRKTMLVLTLVIMGTATFLIGVLPTYNQVGFLAALMLVILRLCQGIAVGGEWGGAVVRSEEHTSELQSRGHLV